MNESPTPSSQNAAGAAKGKRRRAKSGSTSSAIAGTVNHSVVRGASGAPRRKATSNVVSIASSTISTSNPYLRASGKRPFTCRTYATPALTASYQGRTPHRRLVRAGTGLSDDAVAPSPSLASRHRPDGRKHRHVHDPDSESHQALRADRGGR